MLVILKHINAEPSIVELKKVEKSLTNYLKAELTRKLNVVLLVNTQESWPWECWN